MRSNDVPEAAELTVPFIKARQHGTVTGALQVEILRAVPPCRDKGGAGSSHKAQGVRGSLVAAAAASAAAAAWGKVLICKESQDLYRQGRTIRSVAG